MTHPLNIPNDWISRFAKALWHPHSCVLMKITDTSVYLIFRNTTPPKPHLLEECLCASQIMTEVNNPISITGSFKSSRAKNKFYTALPALEHRASTALVNSQRQEVPYTRTFKLQTFKDANVHLVPTRNQDLCHQCQLWVKLQLALRLLLLTILQLYHLPPASLLQSVTLRASPFDVSPCMGQEDLLETGLATHSSILAWRIPQTEEPGGLQSMGSQRVGQDWATNTTPFKALYWKI